MENNNERLRLLSQRWLDGSTTDAEERELRHIAAETASLPDDLQWIGALKGGLDSLAEERAPRPLGRRRPVTVRRIVLWSLSAAAAATLAAVIVNDRQPYCYVNGVPVTDAAIAMNETTCFEHLSELDEAMQVMKLFENDQN